MRLIVVEMGSSFVLSINVEAANITQSKTKQSDQIMIRLPDSQFYGCNADESNLRKNVSAGCLVYSEIKKKTCLFVTLVSVKSNNSKWFNVSELNEANGSSHPAR